MQDSEATQRKKEEVQPLREQMMKRTEHTDLTPLIAQILDGTFKPTVPDEKLELVYNVTLGNDLEGYTINVEEWRKAEAIWNEAKLERNSYVAIFAEEVWRAFKDERDAFSFTLGDPKERRISIYEELEMKTTRLFLDALSHWREKRDSELNKSVEEWTNLDKAYARFKKILHFADVNKVTRGDDEVNFIYRGINTASETMWGLMRMIAALCTKQKISLTAEEVEELFTKSFGPVVTPFASMNVEIASPLLKKIGLKINLAKPVLDTSNFKLVKDEGTGKYKLVMDHAALFSFTDEKGQVIITKQPATETTWCPAKYAVGDQADVIRQYFKWVLELCKKYCFPLVEAEGKSFS